LDPNVLTNILYYSPNLEELYISNIITELTLNCNLTINNIKALKTLPIWILNLTNLEELSISGTSIIQLSNLNEFQKLKNLISQQQIFKNLN